MSERPWHASPAKLLPVPNDFHDATWYAVRPAANTKPATYRCPFCNQHLPALSDHMLVVPEGDGRRRRHAHRGCVLAARKAGTLPLRDEMTASAPTVVVFTSRTCPFCMRAERLLRSKGVRYERVRIWRYLPGGRRPLVQRFGADHPTVPQIVIGDTHVGGCDELLALDRSGELDRLLAA